ncbi:MAG: YhfC family glutamic-type intramembrane protease [Rhodothermales bacterium]
MEAKEIAINLATSGVMLIIAAFIVLLWKRLTRGKLRWISIGCLAWLVSVAVKSAIALLTNEPLFNLLKSVFGNTGYIVLGALWLGILTGLTEIPIGFWIARNRKYYTWKQGSGYGLGFGVFEAGVLAVSFAMLVLTEMFAPGNLPAEVLDLIEDVSWDTVAIANIERLFAVAIHVATGMLIVYSIAAKSMIAFWVAVVYKSTVDGLAGTFHLAGVVDAWNPWLIEAMIFPLAVIGVIMIVSLRRKWPQAVIPTDAS